MDRVGVCWFDDSRSIGEAWISIDGSDAEKVNGIECLSSNTLWVTNLYWKAYMNSDLLKKPNVFDTQFFRTSLQMLFDDISEAMDPALFVADASRILTRLYRLGRSGLGVSVNCNPYRYSSLIADIHTPKAMRTRPMSDGMIDMTEFFKQATQENQAKIGDSPKGSACKKFYFPRATYAKWILTQDYPISDKWKKIEKGFLNKVLGIEDNQVIGATRTTRARLKQLGSEKAVILKISVISQSSSHSKFATFGQGANKYNRAWATLPEVLELSRYSKVCIEDGYTSDLGKLKLPDCIDLDASPYSISKGLLLENFWVALATNPDPASGCTPLGAYIRAYDRIACGRAAEQFHRNSFVVGSYSIGRINVYLRSGQHQAAVELADELGLLSPLSVFESQSNE